MAKTTSSLERSLFSPHISTVELERSICPTLPCCSDCEVFPRNHAAPFSKVLTFYRKEPFSLEAYYNCPDELPYPDPTIGKQQSAQA